MLLLPTESNLLYHLSTVCTDMQHSPDWNLSYHPLSRAWDFVCMPSTACVGGGAVAN